MPTISVLIIMALALPFYSLGNVIRTQLLIPNLRDKPYIISVIAGAGINVGINFMLIPHFGANGAVYGTLLAEITICILQYISVRTELPLVGFKAITVSSVVSMTLMDIAIALIHGALGQGFVSLVVQIVSGTTVFLATFILLSIVVKDPLMKMTVSTLLHVHSSD